MPRKKIRIAIAHPNKDLARAYKARLELDGFEVVIFENQSSAMSHIATLPPDIIITSNYIEGIGLRDFIDLIKGLNVLGDMAILAITDGVDSKLDSYTNVTYIPKTAATSTTVISGVYDLLGTNAIRAIRR